MIAFLLGTAIALALLVGFDLAHPAHAAAPAAAAAQQAIARAAPDPNVAQSGWIAYGAFGLVVALMVAIGTGLVPRFRS